jgi:hypothetical protein
MTSLPDWTHVAPKNAPPFWRYDKPIQKSPQDEREYSIIKLQNGLEAILGMRNPLSLKHMSLFR